jgi:peptidyl-prolyl cis-trans isomerase B (cyclophilin B)
VAKRFVFDTARGRFEGELYPKEAPGTVGNFEKLANSGFYDGTRFHRVIANFVAQGGDPLSKDANNPRVGTGGPGYHIKCETKGNPHKHVAGALSMAHAGKDTGGSQFFVAHGNLPHLDGVHTVFGKVDSPGMETVLAIKQGDVINSVRVTDTP